VINSTRVAVVLLRVALPRDAVRSVLTVVARDALGVVAALLLADIAVTHMTTTELVVVIDALARITHGHKRLDIEERRGSNSGHEDELVHLVEGPIGRSIVDDGAGLRRTDTRQGV
jgi:methyl coenzyme M reductase subunit C-like uncharacterized protein (methanogenesis marker protein 7)